MFPMTLFVAFTVPAAIPTAPAKPTTSSKPTAIAVTVKTAPSRAA